MNHNLVGLFAIVVTCNEMGVKESYEFWVVSELWSMSLYVLHAAINCQKHVFKAHQVLTNMKLMIPKQEKWKEETKLKKIYLLNYPSKMKQNSYQQL